MLFISLDRRVYTRNTLFCILSVIFCSVQAAFTIPKTGRIPSTRGFGDLSVNHIDVLVENV